ncbi:MAG: hypothetical protein Q8P18_06595 [Pseudomonadota bacterium]|nr:hypothetical protein [Pseudomonadota bacterium]
MTWLLALLDACVDDPGAAALPAVDTGAFYAEVEPILGARCGNPACHGSAARPFEVYAVHLHRADPDATWSDAPLTAAEHARDLARARSFLPDALLRKPIDAVDHGGGAVWEDTGEAEWQAIRDWAEQ